MPVSLEAIKRTLAKRGFVGATYTDRNPKEKTREFGASESAGTFIKALQEALKLAKNYKTGGSVIV